MNESVYEELLDRVDKASLNGNFESAYNTISENVSQLFYPVEFDNLIGLVELNKWKVRYGRINVTPTA